MGYFLRNRASPRLRFEFSLSFLANVGKHLGTGVHYWVELMLVVVFLPICHDL